MKVCVVGTDPDIYALCRVVLEELSAGDSELISVPVRAEVPAADVYVWDFRTRLPSWRLGSVIVNRSLFVVELTLLGRYREWLGTMSANVLLAPVNAAVLRPFLEHSVRQSQPVEVPAGTISRQVSAGDNLNDLLDCLLQANLKLQEFDQARTNLLARALHDFRGPLTALEGYCGLLTEQRLGPLKPDQIDLLQRMQGAVRRLSLLAEAMFDLSVGQKPQSELDLQENNVEAAISHAVCEVAPLSEEKHIRITVSFESPGRPVVFDAAKIEQVLVTLLENACRFTPRHGAIDVSGHPVFWNGDSPRPSRCEVPSGGPGLGAQFPNGYRFDVRDSGTTIPGGQMESVFEESTSCSGSKDRSGGGLALAVCRMLVEAHQGRIWAESGPAGTQFCFALPYRASVGSLRRGVQSVADPVRLRASSGG